MSVTVDAVSVEPIAAGTPVPHATPYGVVAEEAPGEAAAEAEVDVVAAWRAISACHAKACALLERELGERHGLGVSDYEVLARLTESDQHKYRAQDLADAVHLSQSALSRLVDRLARNGLVQRFTCDMDRRGIYVQLTEEGQQRYAQARPTHLDILRRTLPGDLIGQ
jgi:DNA-binding MarR family transcriptional regulator